MSPPGVIVQAFADEERAARAVADALGVNFALIDLHTFPDGELLPTIPTTAPTTIVYRSLARPNDKLIALLLSYDAWRRAGARRLVLVAPYLCYLRQDAVFAPGQPVSQKVIGELIGSRFDRVITVDAHLHRTRALADIFPRIEAEDLCAAPALAAWLRRTQPTVDFVVGPDAEAASWVSQVAAELRIEYRVMSKQRLSDVDVRLALGEPEQFFGRSVALVDDVCSSGGTLIKAAEALTAARAANIVSCVTHALFDANVARRLHEAGVSQIASTDAVAHPTNAVSLAALLADALRRELAP